MTGSGTQFNMNVNEVVANRAKQILQSQGKDLNVHPNDHVNHSQSSNDTFPTGLHMVGVLLIEQKLFPAMEASTRHSGPNRKLQGHRQNRPDPLAGRDALDAGPGIQRLGPHDSARQGNAHAGRRFSARPGYGRHGCRHGHQLPEGYDVRFAEIVSELTGTTFRTAPNKFQSLTSKDELVVVHGMLKALACDLMKIANDVRWLSSGPRCGIGEIRIPENEPGSSIMPSKVNPTQCEAVTMVAVQVMGNDATLGIAASQGNFELNVFMPVIAYNLIQSIRLLTDCMDSFRKHCVVGIEPNRERITTNLYNSLILVTGLVPLVGYDKACTIAKQAAKEGLTLKESAEDGVGHGRAVRQSHGSG